ncbi:unannotated protein [freshwater metagenome]|uniref:Unannotated protein n=1 Tax=freshwater metagenome TaxID=449393 RepID=A0A6J7LL96_9ZZZZ
MGLEHLADVHAAGHAERVEHDVDRGAVLEERHVLLREDLGDDALVAVAAGQLVALGDLALLGDVDADQLVDAGRQLVAVLAAEDADADDLAGLAVRDLEAGVADLAGLLAEDGAQQALLRGQLGLALGRHLADEDVAVADLGADADDAALVEVGQDLLGDVRDVPGDLLGAELGVAGVDLVLLDVDRGEDVVLHEALRQDDRVLVVVALPRHERDEQVLAERHLRGVGARAVGDDLALLDPLALVDDGLLVDARALVAAAELRQAVRPAGAVVVHDGDVVRRELLDDAGLLGQHDVTGVDRGAVLHAGADERRLAAQQRDRLAHHVRAHEGAVGVVVLEERDHGGRDRHHLARADVHVVDALGRDVVDLAALAAHEHAGLGEGAVARHRRVGLRDDVLVLLVRGEVVDLVGDPAVLDAAVGRLHEAVRVDPREGGERADQADVRALGGLDRAHAAVVARVHVAHLEAGALARQAARAERRQAALVGQARQRVGLVHELRQLAGAEELLDGGDDRPDVDERLRRDGLDVLGRHALAHDALHAGQAQADLVLDQLADGAQAAVAQVVDVVDLVALLAGVQAHDVVDRGQDVVLGEDALVDRQLERELLVRLVAADLGEVVALRVEEEVLEQRLGRLARRRLARAQLAVDVDQGVVLTGGVVLLERGAHRLVVAVALEDLGVVHAERLEQHRDGLLALAVDAHADGVALVDLELEPGTAARDHLAGVGVLVGGLVDRLVEVDAGRADQLADHDALGAVDDEGALVGHHGEVAHEHRLALDLTGGVVRELGRDEQRRRVRHVLVLALLHGVLGGLEAVVAEAQRHRAGEVLDRGDLLEDLLQARGGRGVLEAGVEGLLDAGLPGLVADQPVERGGLQVQEVRDLEGLPDLGEGQAGGGAPSSQRVGSFRRQGGAPASSSSDGAQCPSPTCTGIRPGRSSDREQREGAVYPCSREPVEARSRDGRGVRRSWCGGGAASSTRAGAWGRPPPARRLRSARASRPSRRRPARRRSCGR